ncbi:hypothetical protein BDP81DRAFT_441302 [Colletotrichum phormii]|uniref:Uncharacterized protein n=1 Tax=Colletotrichum phormii TaxID=359342 RepID=A0AAI9ZE17_9PEZI|nr:uncharacterized protein BDP81DRAFT_441302 [Colletotrichum phormii]KAK1622498.1 hypothetical protein BDP81DRAFT_441302 [Colletotrichum phormii]
MPAWKTNNENLSLCHLKTQQVANHYSSQFRSFAQWCKDAKKPANERVSKDSTIIHFICSRQSMPNQGMWTLSLFQRGK